jgi:hypothetical protein
MQLFKKQPQAEKPEIDWNDCVEYLRSLHQQDYTRLLKVVDIYRGADKGVQKILGIKSQRGNAEIDGMVLDDTVLDFLEDEKPQTKKIEVDQKQ